MILPLGAIAHGSVVRALMLRAARHPFTHGAIYRLQGGRVLAPSYHCSRYNLNTGRLTPAMFEEVFTKVRAVVDVARSRGDRTDHAAPGRRTEESVRALGS